MTQVFLISMSLITATRAHWTHREAVGGAVERSEGGVITFLAQSPCLGLWNHSLVYLPLPWSSWRVPPKASPLLWLMAASSLAPRLGTWVMCLPPSTDGPLVLWPLPCWLIATPPFSASKVRLLKCRQFPPSAQTLTFAAKSASWWAEFSYRESKPFIHPTTNYSAVYSSKSQQETDGTLKLGNWKEFNKGIICKYEQELRKPTKVDGVPRGLQHTGAMSTQQDKKRVVTETQGQ